MSVANIVASIIAQANEQAQEIKKEGEAKLNELKKENASKLEQRREKNKAFYESKKAAALEKARGAATLEGKNAVLKAKHEVIDSIFSGAKAKATKLSGDKYMQILVSLLSKINESSGSVIPGAGEKQVLASACQKAGKNFDIAEEGSHRGGFVFNSGSCDYDFTFDTLFASLKREKEVEIASQIF